jgi:hypothetical protein
VHYILHLASCVIHRTQQINLIPVFFFLLCIWICILHLSLHLISFNFTHTLHFTLHSLSHSSILLLVPHPAAYTPSCTTHTAPSTLKTTLHPALHITPCMLQITFHPQSHTCILLLTLHLTSQTPFTTLKSYGSSIPHCIIP